MQREAGTVDARAKATHSNDGSPMTDHAAAPPRAAYSMAEAAQALGVSERLIKMAIQQNLIRSRKIGALRRIPASEVERVAIEGLPAITYPPRPAKAKRRNS